jgi:hypothetical protein
MRAVSSFPTHLPIGVVSPESAKAYNPTPTVLFRQPTIGVISSEGDDVKREEILEKLASGELTVEEATELLAQADQKRGSMYCKVSQKGALSVYGLQRFPVTLYVEQWEQLFGFVDEIREFASDHRDELRRKTES